MNIKLHIGAHKTATTHIQRILESNRKTLSKKNIELLTPKECRKEWLPSFLQICNQQNTNKKEILRSKIPVKKYWIISEENISGVSYDLILHAGIYPHLQKRLQTFNEIYNDHKTELFFSIRSYETYYRSAYLEVVRNKGYIPFSTFYNKERFKNNSWLSVIEAITSNFSEEKITLWCYEDFKELLPEILKKITTIDNIDTLLSQYTTDITRPSISNKAIEILSAKSHHLSQQDTLAMIEELNEKYPANNTNGSYIPFNRNEIDSFQQLYKQDLIKIKNNYPKIKFLGAKLKITKEHWR